MSEILAIVTEESLVTTSTNLSNPAVLESVSLIADVDTSDLSNGSLLVYKTNNNKWTATKTLDLQNLEGGEF